MMVKKKLDLISVTQAAEILGVTRRTVFRYMYDVEPGLEYFKDGRMILIDRAELDKFIKRSMNNPKLKTTIIEKKRQKEEQKG